MSARHLHVAPNPLEDRPAGRPTKRLNVNLPLEIYEEAERVAHAHRWTLTDFTRLGLSLARIAYEAIREGNRFAVVNDRGRVIKEVLLPR